jgi:hypothetical protein
LTRSEAVPGSQISIAAKRVQLPEKPPTNFNDANNVKPSWHEARVAVCDRPSSRRFVCNHRHGRHELHVGIFTRLRLSTLSAGQTVFWDNTNGLTAVCGGISISSTLWQLFGFSIPVNTAQQITDFTFGVSPPSSGHANGKTVLNGHRKSAVCAAGTTGDLHILD